MSEILPSRIEPHAANDGQQSQDADRQPKVKSKIPAKPAPDLPPIESEEKDEHHQIDELA